MAIFYVGTVIDLLESYVGALSKVLWIFAAPLLSPTIIILPWFEAWVLDTEVHQVTFWIWAVFVCSIAVFGLLASLGSFDE
jgi:hypothetical protein